MANRNTNMGGTDWTEEGLKPVDLNDTFDEATKYFVKLYSDNTGGTISSSTTETDLATLTIGAGELGSSATLDIVAGISTTNGVTANTTHTFRLYVDGVVQKTITLRSDENELNDSGTAFTFLDTGVDNTSAVIVKITCQNSTTNGSGTAHGLVVRGYEKTI